MPAERSVASSTPWPIRWLNWRPLKFVGVLSYSLYLIHYTVIEVLHHLVPSLGPLWLLTGATVLSLAYAYGVHAWVDQPMVPWRRRLRA